MKIGIDVGGTQTRIGLVDKDKIVKMLSKPTNVQNPKLNFEWVIAQIEEWKKTYDLESLGISCPGPLDLVNGIVLDTPNLKGEWDYFKIVDYLKKETNLKTTLDNDANAQANAHALFGDGKGHDVVLFFTISTGLGCGLVINQKVFRGSHGFGCEIANVINNDLGFSYGPLLMPGAIECLASGTGILKYGQHKGLKVNSAKDVFDLYAKKDKVAIEVIEVAQKYTARLFANAIAFLNPSAIIIDGSVATNNHKYMKTIFEMTEKLLLPNTRKKTKYSVSSFKGDAGIIGIANIN